MGKILCGVCFCSLVHYHVYIFIRIQLVVTAFAIVLLLFCCCCSKSRNLIWCCFDTFTSQSFQCMICFYYGFYTVLASFRCFFLCRLCFSSSMTFPSLLFSLSVSRSFCFCFFFRVEYSYAPIDLVNYFTMLHKITFTITICSIFRAYSATYVESSKRKRPLNKCAIIIIWKFSL